MSKLAAEMPGLTQLLPSPSAPVISVNPVIGASPTSLSFTAQQGSSNLLAQTVAISNTGGGTLTWSASASTSWLSVSPVSGTGTGSVTVNVGTAALTAGTYKGVITITATGASSMTVPVIYTVTAAPVPPAIGVSPTNFSFTATQGGSNPATQTLSLSNTGGGTLTWTAADNATWLNVSPTSGTGNGMVTLSVATGTLTAATYSGSVTLSGGSGINPVTVPVTFTVTATPMPPAIGTSPTSLAFTATQGGSNPANQTLSISNTGGGTLTWSASPNTTWLAVSPASATGNGTLTVSASTGILTAGSYTGNIILSATGSSNITIPVTFTVTSVQTISLSPSTLNYSATQGAANPANQTVSLTNTGGTTAWTVSDTASWLSVNPTSGNSSSTLTAAVNTSGLAAGTYTGTITVSAAGSPSKTVGVTLTVRAPTTSFATLTWTPNTDPDLAGYKVYQATVSGAYGAALATVPAGTATYQATGLAANTTYFFVITAYDSAGNESSFSNEVSKPIF